MSYAQSIRAVNVAQLNYFALCDRADTDTNIIVALDILHRAKSAHRALFGTLRYTDGQWE